MFISCSVPFCVRIIMSLNNVANTNYKCNYTSGNAEPFSIKAIYSIRNIFFEEYTVNQLKGLAHAKIIKKSVILFWLLSITI